MTRIINFTKINIDAVPLPESGTRDEYKDTRCEYLRLRVTSTGSKTFSVYKRVKGSGRAVRITVGKYPLISAEAARRQARVIIADTELGINPNEVMKKERLQKIGLREVFDAYIKEKRLKVNTVKGYISTFNCHLSNLQHNALQDITRPMVLETFKRITSPGQANLAMRLLRAIYNFAKEEYIDELGTPIFIDNPVNVISHKRAWHKIEARSSYVRDAELSQFAEALSKVRTESSGDNTASIVDALFFCLLTGLRKSELLSLRWEYVDVKSRFISIPGDDTKNGHTLELPLTPYLLRILSWQNKSESPYVFAGSHSSGRLIEPKKTVHKISDLCEGNCQFHDLRRTFATVAEQLDISLYKRKRLMNHKSLASDVTAGYTIMNCEILRTSAMSIQNYIVDQIGWFPVYPQERLHQSL